LNLLHIIASVSEDYGGPIEALVQADAVGRRLGHRRTIASLDAPGDPWLKRCPIDTVPLGSAAVRRCRRALPWLRYGFTPHLVPWLHRNVGRYDRVVVHGLWNYTTLAARQVLPRGPTPYFVFPHGMLDPWFRAAHPLKHRCKQMTWQVAEGPLLRGARAVLFTSEAERRGAHGMFQPYGLRAVVAGYGTGDAPPATALQSARFAATVPGLGGRPYILFLGRLHPKKGCDLLLRAFAAERHRLPDHHLVLAGPDENGWRTRLEDLGRELDISDRIHWPGMLRQDAKWGAFHRCAAFVLPSHGENFGVAVAEALACGKPVLISDKVAIADVVRRDGAGLVEPDTDLGTAALLARFAGLSPAERARMGARARDCFLDTYSADTVAERTLAILERPEAFHDDP
jgi:glycosyltransferase involved in cell wall biosynthesis